jgi:hypothetical protein
MPRVGFEADLTCECGNGLMTKGHVFWNCKLYEDQRPTVVDILSEKSKRECPESVAELLRPEERNCATYLINDIPNHIYKTPWP